MRRAAAALGRAVARTQPQPQPGVLRPAWAGPALFRPLAATQWRAASSFGGPGGSGSRLDGGGPPEPSPLHYELAQRALDLMNGSFTDNPVRRRRARKQELLAKRPHLKRHELDCGSSEVQIAFMTARIQHLEEHCEVHKKDLGTKRGLHHLKQKRHKLLVYLQRKNKPRFEETIKSLRITMLPSLDSVQNYGRRPKRKRKKMRGRDL